MKSVEITEETIKTLVDQFYIRVRSDSELGPVFNQALGYSDEEWQPHLERMYSFWSSIMLASRRYHGNPIQKHLNLPAFDRSLFDRWLELFSETANEVHEPEVAQKYIIKGQNIAKNFKQMLYPKTEAR
ncbi:MAG: group III truncated hemoglobin [Calditrichia bacterium]